MSTMLQVRNIPDDLHRRLKARAALAGMSMSEFVLRQIERALERPTRAEVLARIAALPPIDVDPPPAELVREERDARRSSSTAIRTPAASGTASDPHHDGSTNPK